jgi:Flp pilus assembly protein TadB
MVALALVAAAVAAALACPAGPPSSTSATRSRPKVGRLVATPLFAAVVVGVAVLALVPTPLGAVLGLGSGWLTWRTVGRLEPRAARLRRSRLEAKLPHVVDLMSAALAAGGSPAWAMKQIAAVVEQPMREELDGFVARLRLGSDPAEIWRAMARHRELAPLGRALVRATESGASVADALARLATDQRARRRADVEALARSIEVKTSAPLGVCLLPAFVLVGIVPMVAGSFEAIFGR